MSESIAIAFIKKGSSFIPSHISEVRKDDIYYLVIDGKPGQHFSANENALLDSQNNWAVSGTPIE